MEIVVIAPHGAVDQTCLDGLASTARVRVIEWAVGGPAGSGSEVLAVAPRTCLLSQFRARITPIAARNLVVRSLLRVSSFDEGRWFWLAASRVPEVLDAALRARVIVASDRDGIYTAWRLARQSRRAGTDVIAVYGYPAARAAIAQAVQAVRT